MMKQDSDLLVMAPPDFYRKIVESQRSLAGELNSEHLPQLLTSIIGELMGTQNAMLISVDKQTPGPWAEKTGSWDLGSYSLDVIRKAISSDNGYQIGGLLEEN